MKEGTNNNTLDILLFACSRGVGKSLFHCSRPKDTEVMSICLRHVEMIVRDRFSSQILPFYIVKKGEYRKHLPSN